MKAVRIVEPGKIEIVDIPQPKCGKGEVLIKVKSVGLCGSDLTTFRGQNPMVTYPRIPGHEVSGTIIASRTAALAMGSASNASNPSAPRYFTKRTG